MAIEEEFGFEIPDKIAATLITVGDMHAYLVAELGKRGAINDGTLIFERMRDVICRQTGVPAHEVVPSARFVQDLRLD